MGQVFVTRFQLVTVGFLADMWHPTAIEVPAGFRAQVGSELLEKRSAAKTAWLLLDSSERSTTRAIHLQSCLRNRVSRFPASFSHGDDAERIRSATRPRMSPRASMLPILPQSLISPPAVPPQMPSGETAKLGYKIGLFAISTQVRGYDDFICLDRMNSSEFAR